MPGSISQGVFGKTSSGKSVANHVLFTQLIHPSIPTINGLTSYRLAYGKGEVFLINSLPKRNKRKLSVQCSGNWWCDVHRHIFPLKWENSVQKRQFNWRGLNRLALEWDCFRSNSKIIEPVGKVLIIANCARHCAKGHSELNLNPIHLL